MSANLARDILRSRTSMSPQLHALHSGSLPGLARPKSVIRRALRSAYKPHRRMPTSEWAAKNRKLTSDDSASVGRWKNEKTPWLVAVMDDMADGSDVWKQIFVSGAQNGKTSAGLNIIGAWMDLAPAPTMIVLPNGTIAKEFGEQRLAPLIRTTKGLKSKLVKDLQRYKIFLGGAIYMASAESGNDLRSKPIKNLYMDEIDGMPHEIKGEGSPISLAINRTNTFKNVRKIFLTSTPTEESTSAIWREYLLGTMEHWFMPCPHCQEDITFEIEGLKWDRENIIRIPDTVHYECTECGEAIWEHQKVAMTRAGKWKSTRVDPENVQEGVVSRRINSLYNPPEWISWSDIAYEYEQSWRSPTKWRDFLNTKLALPVREASESVDWEIVYSRGHIGDEPYKMMPSAGTVVPRKVLFLTGGIDVGSNHIEAGIWGWGRNRQRWMIDHYRLDGNPNHHEIWDQLTEHIRQTYANADGVNMPVVKFLIDTSYLPERVKPWIRKQNRAIVMGVDPMADTRNPLRVDTQADPSSINPSKRTRKGALDVAFVDVSYFKSELMGALSVPEPEAHNDAPPDWVHMPLNSEGVFTKEMAQQLVSEQKTIHRDKNGAIKKITWDRVDGRRAEVLDCHNYARGAARLYGWDRLSDERIARFQAELDAAAAEVKETIAAEMRGAPIKPKQEKKGILIKPVVGVQREIKVEPKPGIKAQPSPPPGVTVSIGGISQSSQSTGTVLSRPGLRR